MDIRSTYLSKSSHHAKRLTQRGIAARKPEKTLDRELHERNTIKASLSADYPGLLRSPLILHGRPCVAVLFVIPAEAGTYCRHLSSVSLPLRIMTKIHEIKRE
jgi:hypothetical protein